MKCNWSCQLKPQVINKDEDGVRRDPCQRNCTLNFDQNTGWGLSIRSIEPDAFREFARRFATSDEIGPIATALDKDHPVFAGTETALLGLFGCQTLCAIACFVVTSTADGSQVCKLDSVIVDSALRRRSLAKMLVASTFSAMATRSAGRLERIYAHSVHPATVRLLGSLGFQPPPPTGAPLSVVNLDRSSRGQFVSNCDDVRDGIAGRMKLECAFCKGNDRRARPWCKTAG